MDCLLFESSSKDRDTLAQLLLAIGVKAISVSAKEEALKVIGASSELVYAIIDVDSAETDGLELVKDLRSNPETSRIKVIVNSTQTGREFVQSLVELGINGYLVKPFDQKKVSQKLKEILLGGPLYGHEKRQHIRVSPDPGELLRLHFRMPGLTVLIAGKIRNISMGGVAVELFNPPEPDVLQPGSRIPKLQFNLGRNSLSPSGNIVVFKEKFLAIRFGDLSQQEREILAHYIYKRLSVPAASSENN